MGHYEQALPLSERSVTISEKVDGPEHPGTGRRLNNLAALYQAMGRPQQALPLIERSLAMSEKANGPGHPSTGTLLNNLVSVYKAMGRYEQALPLCERALAISEKAEGPEHPSTGTSLSNLASLHQDMGRYGQALPLHERALAISEKANGPEHPNTGTQLNNLALLYQDMGRYEQALPLYERALAVSEKAQGPEHPITGTLLNNLASLYQAMGRYEQGLPLSERALAISEKAGGPEHPSTVASLNNLAELYRTMGYYEQALPLVKRALSISEKANGAAHLSTGVLLNNLAALYVAIGLYEQALPLYERALAISEKAQGVEHPTTGTLSNNLASLYQAMGRYEQALALFERALAISERAEGPDHPSTGKRLNNLGGLYQAMGRYEQALPLYERALAISEKAEGPDHPNTGMRLGNLAWLYQAMGRYEQALPLIQRSLAISEKAGGPEHPSMGVSLNNLAALYRVMGRYEQALALLERARAISERAAGPEHPSTGSRLNNLAILYQDMGRYEQALPLFERALAISEKAEGPEHPSTETRLNSLAGLYRLMGRYEQAVTLVERALTISEKANGPEHPSTGERLNNLALLYGHTGRNERALQLYERALSISERAGKTELSWTLEANLMALYSERLTNAPMLYQPQLAIWYGKQAVNTLQSVRTRLKDLDKDLQGGFLKKNEWTYQTLANLLIEGGRIAEAEQVLAMLKEREVFELTRSPVSEGERGQVSYVGVEPRALAEQRRLLAEGVKDATELAALERQRRDKLKQGSGLGTEDEARYQRLSQSAQTWRADYQRFLKSLEPLFAQAASAARADQESTRLGNRVALDPEGAVGLHYVVSDDRVGIIVATPRGSFGRFSAVPRAKLNEQIGALRQAMVARSDTRPAAQALWKMLIEPVRADLQAAGAKTLVLSLTEALRYLPFAALQDEGGRYLIEDYALALWAGAADVTPKASSTAWQVAALGLTQARPGFSALPGVRRELQGIVRTNAGTTTDAIGMLPGSIALDEQFSRARLDAALTGQSNVVHVASHFDFKPGDESRSVLLLGQGEPVSLGQLAVMDFSEVEQLTLSACDTATGGGTNENGAEVEGLAAVVLKAKAQAVLATLWKVADASTAELMHGFYAQHAQTQPRAPSRAQALRQAQLALLRGSRTGDTQATRGAALRTDGSTPLQAKTPVDPARPWAHPYYWAPFVLSGNWL